MGSKICGQIVLQFTVLNHEHETVLMLRIVFVSHLHFSRAPQSPHVKQAVVTYRVEAARHDVRRGQVLEQVEK